MEAGPVTIQVYNVAGRVVRRCQVALWGEPLEGMTQFARVAHDLVRDLAIDCELVQYGAVRAVRGASLLADERGP